MISLKTGRKELINVKITSKRLTALALVLALLLASCAGETSATTMYLRKTEGTVDVSDGEGKDITPKDDLGLYSGYQVGTQAESYAWIDLDQVKLAKLDQDSEVEINKEGKKLELDVKSGSLFFNVTEPLADDETMNIATATMIIGIRGTCGWVTDNTAALLEGTVSVTAGGQEATINAGEMAVLTESGGITVSALTAEDIPSFVLEEVEDYGGLPVPDDSGDNPIEADPMAAYEELLSTLENVVYSEVVDFEGDGSPELLVISMDFARSTEISVGMDEISVWRNELDGPDCVMSVASEMNAGGKYALVESNGRLLVRRYSETGLFGSYVDDYYTSIALSDGVRGEWGKVDSQVSYSENSFVRVRPLDGNGFIDEDGGFEGNHVSDDYVRGSYAQVRDLVRYDGTNVTIVEP